MAREQLVGIVAGGVVGVLREDDALVGADGVVGVVVEGGVHGEVEGGETVAAADGTEAVGIVGADAEEAVAKGEDGVVADGGGQVVVVEGVDGEEHGDKAVASGEFDHHRKQCVLFLQQSGLCCDQKGAGQYRHIPVYGLQQPLRTVLHGKPG